MLFPVFAFSSAFAWGGQEDPYLQPRRVMVHQLKLYGITDPAVLETMQKIERHRFVEASVEAYAYDDTPLPIGHDQTISQPYIVAYMTEAVKLKATDRVLEIGTGSGYQAAVLAELAKEVYTVEIIGALAEEAGRRLETLGYRNVTVRHGDGYAGWPEKAPFDAIVVTAAPDRVPEKLLEQLAVGGRMVVPVGSFFQDLYLYTKTVKGIEKKKLLPVRFVPMVGKEE